MENYFPWTHNTTVTSGNPNNDGGEPEKFEDRIIFMSMYNDIGWGKAENDDICVSNSSTFAAYAKRFPKERRCHKVF